MGNVNKVSTGIPLSNPGVQLGDKCIIRRASSSKYVPADLITFGSTASPTASILN